MKFQKKTRERIAFFCAMAMYFGLAFLVNNEGSKTTIIISICTIIIGFIIGFRYFKSLKWYFTDDDENIDSG